jgi:hypothetical protein
MYLLDLSLVCSSALLLGCSFSILYNIIRSKISKMPLAARNSIKFDFEIWTISSCSAIILTLVVPTRPVCRPLMSSHQLPSPLPPLHPIQSQQPHLLSLNIFRTTPSLTPGDLPYSESGSIGHTSIRNQNGLSPDSRMVLLPTALGGRNIYIG